MNQTVSTTAPIRVMIVDDSRTMRAWMRNVIRCDPRIEVVAEAQNARQARILLRELRTDVLTLDIEMPETSGLDFLSQVMREYPMPVIMLSSFTEGGRDDAQEALSRGAVDCIPKPQTDFNTYDSKVICNRIYRAGQSNRRTYHTYYPPLRAKFGNHKAKLWTRDVILIGASTGGIAAVEDVLTALDCVSQPVVVAQHMPKSFLDSFCRRLSQTYARNFTLAKEGMVLREDQGVIAVGGEYDTRLHRNEYGQIVCSVRPTPVTRAFSPSVDALFLSAASANLTGHAALLTGMGEDGAQGLAALRKSGMYTFAQDQKSCVVFGMPRAAIACGGVDEINTPTLIGDRISKRLSRPDMRGRAE